jgi:putative DNA methylase
MEAWLEEGHGSCALRDPEVRKHVEQALTKFDGVRLDLDCAVIMPNHVHVLVEIADDVLLSDVVWGWKQFSARQMNRLLGRSGRVWHRDYFDRFIRNSEHLHRTIRYIEANPVKDGLVNSPEEFRWSSAGLNRHYASDGD